jgi:hypothetical protein
MIETLKPNQVFVFGSNTSGNHAGGAARQALESFGAVYGQDSGLQGQSYAIPTLDENFEKLPLEEIRIHLEWFKAFAQNNDKKEFLLTKIGCGIASFEISEIAPLCSNMPSNVVLPKEFIDFLNRKV